MENVNNDHIIPDHEKGSKLDTENAVRAATEQEAKQMFATAVNRLLDVNCWDKIAGAMSATFRLTDAQGNEISRPAQVGDHFKIDIPGPGPVAGDGYDWVKVEKVEDLRNASSREESVTMRVRPAPSPKNDRDDVAHFFDESATSSFRVERIGNVVTAQVHGRNEIPNTGADSVVDKARNAMVGAGAVAGFSSPQWNGLVKGLLDPSTES